MRTHACPQMGRSGHPADETTEEEDSRADGIDDSELVHQSWTTDHADRAAEGAVTAVVGIAERPKGQG